MGRISEITKKFGQICEQAGYESIYDLHKQHFADIKQRSFYRWIAHPHEMDLGLLRRIAKLVKMTDQGLIDALMGKRELD